MKASPVANENSDHDDRAEQRQPHPRPAVGVVGDRDLEDERHAADQADDREDPLVVEPEGVADLREEDAEGGAVELVDGVEAEEDEQRVDRAAAGDLLEAVAAPSSLRTPR